ncbi:hypothetical protein INS49_004395 [Diaporthe citri]|uniref:uncharacterized protein n=1 Tax=Diaporthe citri TaxID=83186 RepID=UPI001C80BF3E|nr:uncharacterized protein INS49_004395 [Diaporthe citri]KAG6354378.1 hypothetical protein INS49_004395 [Diaporthe citri]
MSTADVTLQAQDLFGSHPVELKSLGVFLAAITFLIILFRQWALPKPIPGIPHRADAVTSILGDLTSIGKYMASGDVTFFDWLTAQSKELNSPIFQTFPKPLGRPMVVLNDFREAQDILMRRGKEFDRAYTMINLFSGIIPNHHIVEKTNAVWKSHRRLLQDLMSPGFLDGVAAPVIYHHVSNLVRLWEMKAQIAHGRPFKAATDIYNTALDAVNGFTYGQGFEHRAIQPTLEYFERTTQETTEKLRGNGGVEDAIEFPIQPPDEVVRAAVTVTSAFADVQTSPVAHLKWPLLTRMPKLVKAKEIRDNSIRKEIHAAVERAQTHPDPSSIRSAVEHMVRRETTLAEKEGRAPDFFSTTMFDELFGFVIGGHDTTSTTFSWGVKFLADNPHAQTRLRSALQSGFSAAKAEGRAPTVQEITSSRIPYLEAAQEEILRCAPTLQIVEREALVDTVVLGHKIPKGTVVTIPSGGNSVASPVFEIDEARRHSSSQEARKSGKSRHDWDPMDSGEFKPERWLVNDGNEFDSAAGPQLTFSLGTRSCFGKRLAYLQLRILVTLVVWNFELSRCPDELSGYGHKSTLTTEPTQCFVRLSKVQL